MGTSSISQSFFKKKNSNEIISYLLGYKSLEKMVEWHSIRRDKGTSLGSFLCCFFYHVLVICYRLQCHRSVKLNRKTRVHTIHQMAWLQNSQTSYLLESPYSWILHLTEHRWYIKTQQGYSIWTYWTSLNAVQEVLLTVIVCVILHKCQLDYFFQ